MATKPNANNCAIEVDKMGKVSSICVSYKYADDWHVFQSEDLLGLYIANKDAKVAYEDVQKSIEKLILLNEGVQCAVTPELTFAEFIAAVNKSISAFLFVWDYRING